MTIHTAEDLFDSLSPAGTMDETVRDYVCSLLEEADPEDDAEGLVATLQAFLVGDGDEDNDGDDKAEMARELVERWMVLKKEQAGPTQPPRIPFQNNPLPSPKLNVTPPVSPKATIKSESDNSLSPASRSQKRQQRKDIKKGQKGKQKHINKLSSLEKNSDDTSNQHPTTNWADKDDDDFATAWNECKEQGVAWGGRGRGGRGVQAGSNSIHGNIHLANVTVSVPGGGLELLDNARFDLTTGHRYGLVGR